jgi:hypothetical protein
VVSGCDRVKAAVYGRSPGIRREVTAYRWFPFSRALSMASGTRAGNADPTTAGRWTLDYLRMFTARAITSAVVDSAIALWPAMRLFAHRVSGIVSVGENAVALVKLT